MAVNEDQVAFLDYFCDDKHSFDYAVLIDAPWGSGKTYFLREYLKKKFPASTTSSSDAPAYLWVSLFGRTNASEVRDALFAEAHPWLSSKWGALVGSAGSGLLKKFTGLDIGDKALAKQFLPDITAKLIVFDDLERCTISPANALGLINSFVESGAFKVIVIANQKPFVEDQEYRLQKEKVIGRTLTVMSDPDAVLDELTKGVRDTRARDAVTANRDEVLAVFRESGYHNFRSLRAALDDFDRLVTKSDARLAVSTAALRELLLYIVAIGFEVRADAVRGDKLEQLLNAATRLSLGNQLDPIANEARTLTSKYPSVQWRNPIISPSILGGLITGGILPLQEINDGLSNHPLVVGAEKVRPALALWGWTQLNATDYARSKEALVCQFNSRSIMHPGEILHVAGTLIWLEEFGDKLLANIEHDFIIYIDDLLKDGTLMPETAVFETTHSGGWGGRGFHKADNQTFKTIYAHLKRAVGSAHRVIMVDEANKLLRRLRTVGSEGDLYEFNRKNGQFGGVPLLQNIAICDFVDILMKDFLYNTRLIAALQQRYAFGHVTLDLIEEKLWVIELEAELRGIALMAPPPFYSLLTKQTDNLFRSIREDMKFIEASVAAQSRSPDPGSP